MTRQKRIKRKRREERRARLFENNFHSKERVLFIKSLPCEVTGRMSATVVNAHMKSRGAGGTYRDIVPLSFDAHRAFDEMPESKFEALYQRTKQSIKDCAPAYQLLWEESQDG